ncbi:MAG: helix-turn-helix transcriptional regulator [Candidatus Peribacteraceae bacterium]|nr:helix-turn-helix transcriptional regulator [Candidatus Peribacteraceae bacterium]
MQHKDLQIQLRDRLKQLRKRYQLTQEELARKAGLSLYYVQLLEGKKPKNPTLLVLEKIAKVYNIPVWKLIRFDK